MTYRSDKNLVQDLFFPFNLAVMALEGLNAPYSEQLASELRDKTQAYLDGFMAKQKIYKLAKRAEILTHIAIKDIVEKKKLSNHKFILVLYCLAELIVNEGHYIPEFVEDIFNRMLEMENEKEMKDDEWLKLKASSEKQAAKILTRLKAEGFFILNPTSV